MLTCVWSLVTDSFFDLSPEHPAYPSSTATPHSLTERDARQFAAIVEALAAERVALTARRVAALAARATAGQAVVERDLDVQRTTARLGLLGRFDADLCLGRMILAGRDEPLYVGRTALRSERGERLLIDWRAAAAAPFFAATSADPRGLVSRRRFAWRSGRIVDFWDEAFVDDPSTLGNLALDEQSAFIASLGASRDGRMRDVLTTIQADQDAIIRSDASRPLVVDGGPGTGKTVVALHRAAYLLAVDRRIREAADRAERTHRGGGVLVVAPSDAYVAYADDVLPSLGEDDVRLCTLDELVPEGAGASIESNRAVAAAKGSLALLAALESVIARCEPALVEAVELDTPWGLVRVTADSWRDAAEAVEPGTPHNDARAQVWEWAAESIVRGFDPDRLDEDALDRDARITQAFRRRVNEWLTHEDAFVAAFERAWPLIDPASLVAQLYADPALLARHAPGLNATERAALHRTGGPWTRADLPILDAARRRLGDPAAERRRHERAKRAREQSEQREWVASDLIAADDGDMGLMSMLKTADVQNTLFDRAGLDDFAVLSTTQGGVDGPFAHVVVDEAQELTDAEWRMILARCPSRSVTVVGDRAQSREPFPETWAQRLDRVGFRGAQLTTLSINYRTPREIMELAEPVIRAVLPDANVPTSVRASGLAVERLSPDDAERFVRAWLAERGGGVVAVIDEAVEGGGVGRGEADESGVAYAGDDDARRDAEDWAARLAARDPRVTLTSPRAAKGLEFDLVVLRPGASSGGPGGAGSAGGERRRAAVDRYVAMTRATAQLIIVEPEPEPEPVPEPAPA